MGLQYTGDLVVIVYQRGRSSFPVCQHHEWISGAYSKQITVLPLKGFKIERKVFSVCTRLFAGLDYLLNIHYNQCKLIHDVQNEERL